MLLGKKISTILLATTATIAGVPAFDTPRFDVSEIPVFNYQYQDQSQILIMDYASYVIQNSEEWENKDGNKKVFQVDIIFTKYPYYKKDWITDYDSLLKNRIKAILALEPEISKNVKWNIILQTNCRNEEEAKKLFHGVVLWYNIIDVGSQLEGNTELKIHVKKVKEVTASQNIVELMSGNYVFPDSTVYHAFDRNKNWTNMLIVNDWTASMYQYGVQALLWHQSNLEKPRVSRFAFFNDGDNLKKIAKTKGIYFAEPENVNQIVQVMKRVQKNGNGGDTPESYIEALLTAISKTKKFNELILIADNKSPIKDIYRLKELDVPVRIIICGVRKGETIRHDYLQIASSTKGSVHSIEEDIYNVSEIKEGEKIKILDVEYQRTRGRIIKYKPKNTKPHL